MKALKKVICSACEQAPEWMTKAKKSGIRVERLSAVILRDQLEHSSKVLRTIFKWETCSKNEIFSSEKKSTKNDGTAPLMIMTATTRQNFMRNNSMQAKFASIKTQNANRFLFSQTNGKFRIFSEANVLKSLCFQFEFTQCKSNKTKEIASFEYEFDSSYYLFWSRFFSSRFQLINEFLVVDASRVTPSYVMIEWWAVRGGGRETNTFGTCFISSLICCLFNVDVYLLLNCCSFPFVVWTCQSQFWRSLTL